jgi:CO/xanthine dehydrogenase Mo-binding subunit
MGNFKYIGSYVERPDAINKAIGKALFLDDISLPEMLHAEILTPPYAHALIKSIDTSEAEISKGVVKVVTGEDCNITYGDCVRDRYPMAKDKVRYIGDPVAAVIATSVHYAREAVKKIKVEYEKLPVYTDALESLKEDSVLIHDKNGEYWHLSSYQPVPKTNIAMRYILKKGDSDKAFQEADAVAEGEFIYPFGSSAAIEPHGAIAWFHEDGKIEVWSSSICPFIIQDDIARTYGRQASDVRVHIPEIGGCFGYKSDVTIEQTVAYIASFVPGKPVKWVATRAQDFTSTLIAHGARIRMKIGAKKDGKLVAIKSMVYHSVGAYADTGVNVTQAATHTVGPYEFPNAYLEGLSVYTNTPPVGAYRGYGYQYPHLALERLLNIIARKLNIGELELREKNYLAEGKETALGEKIWKIHGDVKKCSDNVKKAIFEHEKPKEDKDYYYGRGFASIVKGPKGAPNSSKGCYMKLNGDGSVTVSMGGAEVGQGLRTVVRQVASEALKISPDKIGVYTEIDTQFSPWEWQTIGSMFTVQGGRAVVRAAEKIILQLKKNASYALKCDIDMLEYDGECVYLKADPSVRVLVKDLVRGYMTEDGITVGDVVQSTSSVRLPRYSLPDLQTGQGNMGVSYTFGSQGCEIRISKTTGEIFIDHFASSFDIGQVINPVQLRGQIVGGVMMGIGATLFERLKFDEDGKIINPHFSKYRFPTFKDAPKKQTVDFVETPDAVGPFGARGIGEHPVLGVAPSILNAIYDAIGIDFFSLPITPEMIKSALKKRRNKEAINE